MCANFKRERYACQRCPAFYKVEKPDLAATAGGYEAKEADGRTILCCRPATAQGRAKRMKQFAFYCLATPLGKMIAGMADYTGNVPAWCPRLEENKNGI